MWCFGVQRKAYLVAWVRWGDGSAMHPRFLEVLDHPECDDRLLNEVAGFVSRCAAQSGLHSTDYVVTLGTAKIVGGMSRWELLTQVCVFAELMTEVFDEAGTVIAFKLVDDDPEFLHLRLKAELDWERQRKADANRPNLIVPVRLRDGDGCRWCGAIVDWNYDRKSGRAGTYDHLIPGEAATVDTYLVCCKSCNGARQAGEFPPGVTQLLDPPADPHFSRFSVKWLTENKWRISQGLPVPDASPTYVIPGRRVDGTQPPRIDRPSGSGPTDQTGPASSRTRRSKAAAVGAPAEPSGRGPESTRVADESAPSAPAAPANCPEAPGAECARTAVGSPAAPADDQAGHDLSPPGLCSASTDPVPDLSGICPDLADPDRSGQIDAVQDLSSLVGSGRVGSVVVDRSEGSQGASAARSRGGRGRRSRRRGRSEET